MAWWRDSAVFRLERRALWFRPTSLPSMSPHTTPRTPSSTVREMADVLQVSESSVRRWISKGLLTATRSGRSFSIPGQPNAAFISTRLQAAWARPILAYVPPEISRYSEWHQVLDELVWLAKAVYSDRSALKRRRFRLDVLFARYLTANGVDLRSIRKSFSPTSVSLSRGVWEDLQRGWYNELAFSFPQRPSALGLSFSDVSTNGEASAKRFTFPSWRITAAYYSVYFYLRALTRLKQPSFRLAEHGATLTNFKACALQPLQNTVWFYPLSIDFVPGTRHSANRVPQLQYGHLRHAYARHPRPPYLTPEDAHRHVLSVFRRRASRSSKTVAYTLFDYLHDFRIWANYLEIEHLLNLRGAGYKAFMDQALAFILFFVGGITELVLIASSSPTRFLNHSQRFFSLLAASSAEVEVAYPELPLAQRLDLFSQLGLLRRGLIYPVRIDPNQVRARFDD
jgi:excisionase family DNA binding protein